MVVNTEGTVGTSFPNSNWASLNANSAAHLSKQEYTRSIEEKQATTGHACVRPCTVSRHVRATQRWAPRIAAARRQRVARVAWPARDQATTRGPRGGHAGSTWTACGSPTVTKERSGVRGARRGGSRGAHLTLTGARRQRSHTSPPP